LASLVDQSLFPDFEVLLDLNAPSKRELEIVNRFSLRYGSLLKVEIKEDVTPLGEAWNRCINRSTSGYLTIWNVDDERTPTSLEVQYEALNASKKYSAVYGPYRVISKPGESQGRLVDNFVESQSAHLSGFHLGPFFMFKKEVTGSIGFFDEQFKSGNDFDFAIRLARSFQILRVDSELGSFLDEGRGASTRPNSLQEIESNVIQYRYGSFEGLDYLMLYGAFRYSVALAYWNGKWHPISKYFPKYFEYVDDKYDQFLANNRNKVFKKKMKRKLLFFLGKLK